MGWTYPSEERPCRGRRVGGLAEKRAKLRWVLRRDGMGASGGLAWCADMDELTLWLAGCVGCCCGLGTVSDFTYHICTGDEGDGESQLLSNPQ